MGSSNSRRITLLIHSLDGGGAERLASQMANEWADHGSEVCLITLDSVETDRYPISTKVNRVGLGLMSESKSLFSRLSGNFSRIRQLRKAIKTSRPDHVVSLVDKMNVLTVLATTGTKYKVIGSEHIDPRQHEIGKAWDVLRRLTYPRLRALTVLTESVVEFASRFTKGKPIYVVPNFVDAPDIDKEPLDVGDHSKQIISLGRLAPQKGFDRLITAFAQISMKISGWNLVILGEGPLRPELEKQIRELSLGDRIKLCGWVDNPSTVLASSDLFVMSSHYEGFPMALLEAMANRLPVISFDCQSGPGEIIHHDVDGLLVPQDDVEALASSMFQLISDEPYRRRIAGKAGEVTKRFSRNLYFERWEAILGGQSLADYRKAC